VLPERGEILESVAEYLEHTFIVDVGEIHQVDRCLQRTFEEAPEPQQPVGPRLRRDRWVERNRDVDVAPPVRGQGVGGGAVAGPA
jgi:hypothetical protein